MYTSTVKQIFNKFCGRGVINYFLSLCDSTDAPNPCSATKLSSARSHQSKLLYRKANSPASSQDNLHQRGKTGKKPPACLGYPNALLAKTDHINKHNPESKTADQSKEATRENSKKSHVGGRCR